MKCTRWLSVKVLRASQPIVETFVRPELSKISDNGLESGNRAHFSSPRLSGIARRAKTEAQSRGGLLICD